MAPLTLASSDGICRASFSALWKAQSRYTSFPEQVASRRAQLSFLSPSSPCEKLPIQEPRNLILHI